jgi:hypothetical protein
MDPASQRFVSEERPGGVNLACRGKLQPRLPRAGSAQSADSSPWPGAEPPLRYRASMPKDPIAIESALPSRRDSTVLMFSGGRDSTLAAARLHEEGAVVTLVTLSSDHLRGINRVHDRLRDMRHVVPTETVWIHLRQPTDLKTDTSFYERTCLPCHHAYVVAAAVIAKAAHASTLAFGYAGYQNTWPEQTPLAVDRLRFVLHTYGIRLNLPVYDIGSREEACAELARRGLTTEALEQKCLRQVSNVALAPERLQAQVSLWEAAIVASLSSIAAINLEVLDVKTVGRA